jgi:cAMP-dependent protein kinase regulator
MDQGGLGATYDDGEIIVRQGDVGDKMFVIQKGQAQILVEKDGRETPIRVAQEGELIGEMAIFERHVRSATVRALGEVARSGCSRLTRRTFSRGFTRIRPWRSASCRPCRSASAS